MTKVKISDAAVCVLFTHLSVLILIVLPVEPLVIAWTFATIIIEYRSTVH